MTNGSSFDSPNVGETPKGMADPSDRWTMIDWENQKSSRCATCRIVCDMIACFVSDNRELVG